MSELASIGHNAQNCRHQGQEAATPTPAATPAAAPSAITAPAATTVDSEAQDCKV